MIQLTRALVRHIRNVFRKLTVRSPPTQPMVLFHTGSDGLRVRLFHGVFAAEYHAAGIFDSDAIALPLAAMTDFEGRLDAMVSLESTGPGTVQARWVDGDVPQVRSYESSDPGKLPAFPAMPDSLTAMESGLWCALAETRQCVASDAVRFALNHVQLRGRSGTVVATDGRQLLLQGGFAFPWNEDVLVPASSVFTSKDLQPTPHILVGKSDAHVTMQFGSWSFHLLINKQDRFPSVDEVVPNSRAVVTQCRFDAQDNAYLLRTLPRLPGGSDDDSPVTVDLNGKVVVRAKAADQEQATEVELTRSEGSGKAVRVSMNRVFLQQAIEFGLTQLKVVNADTPVVFENAQRKYVVMPLGKGRTLAPTEGAICLSTGKETVPNHPPKERTRTPVIESANNGVAGNGHTVANANGTAGEATTGVRRRKTKNSGLAALIEEAESLKTALRDAFSRSHQLLRALKRHRKQSQIVQTTLKSLRELQSVE